MPFLRMTCSAFLTSNICMQKESTSLFFFFLVQQKMESSIFSLKFSIRAFHEGGEKTLDKNASVCFRRGLRTNPEPKPEQSCHAGVVEAAQLVVGQDALTSHLPLHEVALLGRWGLRLEITQSLTHLESEL